MPLDQINDVFYRARNVMLVQNRRESSTLYLLQINQVEGVELDELAIDCSRADHVSVNLLFEARSQNLKHCKGRIEWVNDHVLYESLQCLHHVALLLHVLESILH